MKTLRQMLNEHKIYGTLGSSGIQLIVTADSTLGRGVGFITSPGGTRETGVMVTFKDSWWDFLWKSYQEIKALSAEQLEKLERYAGENRGKPGTWPLRLMREYLQKKEVPLSMFEFSAYNMPDSLVQLALDNVQYEHWIYGDGIPSGWDKDVEESKEGFRQHVLKKQKKDSVAAKLLRVHFSGSLKVDHDARTVSIEDATESGGNRMGTYKSNSNAAYVLVRSNFSFENPEEIRKLLASVGKQFPALLEYEFTDVFGDDLKMSVRSIISRKGGPGEIGSSIASSNNLRAGRGEIIAYHGTSNSIWNKIRKSGGLVPGLGPEYSDKIKGHSENLVYLTTDINHARRYAVRAAKSSGNMVLRVKISDMTKVAFDEDATSRDVLEKTIKRLGVKNFLGMLGPIYGKTAVSIGTGSMWDAAEMSDGTRHQIHPGVLFDDERLRGVVKDPEALKRLRRIIGYEAIGYFSSSGNSFGYSGKIPLKNIEVAETGKSERYTDYDPKRPNADAKNADAYAAARINRDYKK